MANNYEQIMALVNAGNKMGLSNAITRDNGIPLDLSSVYNTYEDAVVYAATKAIAYQNQVIAAEGIVYVIVAESQGKVKIGEVEYDNYLKPVGTAPTGDDASISVTAEGLVSVFGFAAAQDGTLPVRENGVLTWKTLEAIGAGDGNDNTTYEFALTDAKTGIIVTPYFNGQPIMEGEEGAQTQKKFELVLDVYTKAEADEKYLAKADYTPYDDTALANRVKALEDEERYDETPLANRVTTIEETIGDAEGGLVKDIADNTKAIADNAKAIEDLEDAYVIADEAVLNDAKDYTDAEIGQLEIDIERINSVDYIVIKKNGTEINKVNASLFVQDSFLDDVSYDSASKKISFTWKMGDGTTKNDEVDIADLIDTYTNGTGLKLEGNEFSVDTEVIATVEALNEVSEVANKAQTTEQVTAAIENRFTEANLAQYAKAADVEATFEGYYTKTEVDNKGYAVATEVAETYATKTELGEAIEGVENELAAYAKTADVNAELAKKIETGSIAHTTDEVAEGVTVNGTQMNIVVDAFTKAETRKYVADTISQMTGGESAADVLLALNNYKSDNDARVGAIETKDGEQDTAIATAQAQADKGVADAKAANDAVIALTNGTVATNASDISAIKTRLNTLETAKGDHETRISGAEGKITALEAADATINAAIGTLQGNITALTNKDSEIAGQIATINEDLGKKADKTALETLEGKVYTKTEVDELFANFDQTAITEAIAANKKAIEDEVARATAAEGANKTLIDTLIGEDANKSVRTIAGEEVAKVIDSAPEAFDTLKEIATWIQDDATGAAAMSATIAGHSTILAGFGGEGEPADVKTYVNDQIAAATYELPVATLNALGGVKSSEAENGVAVAADGTMSVNSVNVNKLVQTEGEELILNGGSAK